MEQRLSSSREREKLVEGLKEDRLAELDHFGWNAKAAFPSERASMALSSSSMVGLASSGVGEK